MIKKILIGVLALAMVIGISIFFFFKNDQEEKYDVEVATREIPTFDEVPIGFNHIYNSEKSLPFSGGAIIDVDNDGTEEIFFGGGYGQQDALFTFKDGAFKKLTSFILPKKKREVTFGVVSFDINNDQKTDMYVVRDNGIYQYINTGTSFESQKLDIPFTEKSTPLSVTLGDINQDGWVDMYVSTYIKLEMMEGINNFSEEYGARSILLINNGDNTFTDITQDAGIAYTHNTFQGVFIDVDDDGKVDLVVAHDTGHVRTYKNNGDSTFTVMRNPLSEDFGYPMGIAVGDYNNDSRPDFFFSNTGSTVPESMARGELDKSKGFNCKWMLFENTGKFKFKDVADKTKLADYEFSWGAVFEDFNIDGREDLAVAENYVDFGTGVKALKLPCRFLIQNEKGEFAAVEKEAGVINQNDAISPLTADFNGDGYPDLVYINLGDKPKAFLSKGGSNNFIRIKLKDDAQTLGAQVKVISEASEQTKYVINSEGLLTDQSHVLIFGLGKENHVYEVKIKYLDGSEDKIVNPFINKTLIAGKSRLSR